MLEGKAVLRAGCRIVFSCGGAEGSAPDGDGWVDIAAWGVGLAGSFIGTAGWVGSC